jgi:hypothetical protein
MELGSRRIPRIRQYNQNRKMGLTMGNNQSTLIIKTVTEKNAPIAARNVLKIGVNKMKKKEPSCPSLHSVPVHIQVSITNI